jgi:hypothetical protein
MLCPKIPQRHAKKHVHARCHTCSKSRGASGPCVGMSPFVPAFSSTEAASFTAKTNTLDPFMHGKTRVSVLTYLDGTKHVCMLDAVDLHMLISEKTPSPIEELVAGQRGAMSIRQVTDAIRWASADPHVKAVVCTFGAGMLVFGFSMPRSMLFGLLFWLFEKEMRGFVCSLCVARVLECMFRSSFVCSRVCVCVCVYVCMYVVVCLCVCSCVCTKR